MENTPSMVIMRFSLVCAARCSGKENFLFWHLQNKAEDFVDRVEGNLVPWNFVFAEESGFKGFGTGVGFGAFHGSKENHMRLASMR